MAEVTQELAELAASYRFPHTDPCWPQGFDANGGFTTCTCGAKVKREVFVAGALWQARAGQAAR